MSEKIPYHEPLPDELEVRRDALLSKIIELREAVKTTTLNLEVVSKELDELDVKVQRVQGIPDIKIFEETLALLEKIVDSKKQV